MGVKKILLEFDNQVKSFFPGQNVSGKLIVITEKKKTIQGLSVKCVGKAKVRWTDTVLETSPGKGNKKTVERKVVVYQNEEKYFDFKLNFLQNESKSPKNTIPSGTNTYDFNFILPNGLPSSYVGKSGQVFYYLEAQLSRKGKHDLISKIPFTVNGILDLNKEPGTIQSMEQRKYKYLCCLCCKNGPIGFVFKLHKKGFVPGEQLKFLIEMNNQSSRKIKGITLALVQNVKFYAKGNSMEDTRVIRKLKGPSLDSGDDDTWRYFLQIPPIPPTRLANASCIIDVQYSIQVEMDVSGLAVNLKGEIPIIIGTIPLRQNFYELTQPQINDGSIPELNGSRSIEFHTIPNAPTSIFNDYPDLPPPTYTQAMALELDNGKQNVAYKPGKLSIAAAADVEDDDEIDLNYLPTYITYGFYS